MRLKAYPSSPREQRLARSDLANWLSMPDAPLNPTAFCGLENSRGARFNEDSPCSATGAPGLVECKMRI